MDDQEGKNGLSGFGYVMLVLGIIGLIGFLIVAAGEMGDRPLPAGWFVLFVVWFL